MRARDLAVPFAIVELDTRAVAAAGQAAADVLLRELGDRTVAQCLPEERRELPVVDPDATVLEIAALMARSRSPLVAVLDRRTGPLGAVTLVTLRDRRVTS